MAKDSIIAQEYILHGFIPPGDKLLVPGAYVIHDKFDDFGPVNKCRLQSLQFWARP